MFLFNFEMIKIRSRERQIILFKFFRFILVFEGLKDSFLKGDSKYFLFSLEI